MKFYISYNVPDIEQALALAHQTSPFAHGLVIGHLLLYRYGIEALKAFRAQFPNAEIIADAKICDRAQEATSLLVDAGIDSITVLAGASNETIYAASKAAHSLGAKVFLDLLDAYSMGQSALDAEQLGVDAILFHRSHEHADMVHLTEEWDATKGNTKLPIWVDGSISRANIEHIIALRPHAIIIGTAITQAGDAGREAEYFQRLLSGDTSS